MATGLTALQAAIASLTTIVTQVDADVKKLIANSGGTVLQPGQVIVNQSDIDTLTASTSAAVGVLTADDASANPPAKQ